MVFFNNKKHKKSTTETTDYIETFAVDSNGNFTSTELIHTYWWDVTTNFGDLIGPWLITLMTDRPVSNSKYLNINRTMFTVGSIIEHASSFPNQKISIWGSGLIQPLDNPKKIKKLRRCQIDKILAVRGSLTRQELSKIYEIDNSLPLGDPALLLPRFFSPCLKNINNISIVPHFNHKSLFESYEDTFNIINVMQSPKNVVAEIASSKICISTSLHGIIIAQAYNIPWLLLRIADDTLLGDMFKFNDFFSTLKGEEFPIKTILASDLSNLDFNKLAKEASLIPIKTNLNDLLDAFSME